MYKKAIRLIELIIHTAGSVCVPFPISLCILDKYLCLSFLVTSGGARLLLSGVVGWPSVPENTFVAFSIKFGI